VAFPDGDHLVRQWNAQIEAGDQRGIPGRDSPRGHPDIGDRGDPVAAWHGLEHLKTAIGY
jgi:hypothetical protein